MQSKLVHLLNMIRTEEEHKHTRMGQPQNQHLCSHKLAKTITAVSVVFQLKAHCQKSRRLAGQKQSTAPAQVIAEILHSSASANQSIDERHLLACTLDTWHIGPVTEQDAIITCCCYCC